MSGQGSSPGWYTVCVAYFATPAAIRKEISPQTLATYRRIRQLPPAWGQELDRRGAPLAVVRWVAWGKEAEVRERRYAEVLASWPRWGDLACRDGAEGQRQGAASAEGRGWGGRCARFDRAGEHARRGRGR